MQGSLSLVGTPIGNLSDITYRAVTCLKNVGHICAEDTRRTRALLSHLGIEGKKVTSLHAHSTERDIATLIEILSEGRDVALVTDAGMPGISDPGSELVRAARLHGIAVTVVPGPSAVTTAVALSGLVDGPFTFLGFLPRKGKKRKQVLSTLEQSLIPTVLFESPHRLRETLRDLAAHCGGQRMISISRELTKMYEETRVVSLETAAQDSFFEVVQGEFTLVIEGRDSEPLPQDEIDVEERALCLLSEGNSVKDIVQILSRELEKNGEKSSRREIYALVVDLASSREHDPETMPQKEALSTKP